MFCSILHRWQDWITTESDVQIRYCESCNKMQRKLVKLKTKRTLAYELPRIGFPWGKK